MPFFLCFGVIGYFDILGVTFPKEIAVILKIWAYQSYTLECMIRISHQFLHKIAPYHTFKLHALYLHFPTTNKKTLLLNNLKSIECFTNEQR